HELRTPLNAIIGYSELIREDATDENNEQLAADADAVVRSARHLLELINDILDLSKIESGRLKLSLEDFDVAAMLRDVVTVAQPLVERQGNVLRLTIDREPVSMYSDQTKIRQCIFNLVSNAAKFTENGTIDLSLRHEDLGALSCLVFEVQDSGIGMSPAELAKLFDAFSQIDSELGRRHTGSGLGLTITRRLARKLGGDIQVHSEVGAGTAFMIRLPVRYQRASESTTWGRSLAAAIEKSSSSLRIGDLQR
ncbi:MAG: HAMP domain-containing histidine kinase, partial [Myxococcales bacterium]|nr:HAMP domain-containing histidine kinase [Myxococcales bacterium]